jgi:hypothetical protein
MSRHTPLPRSWHTRRRCQPAIESLEVRDLPSSHPLGPALPGHHYPTQDVQQFVPILYPPGTPQPTPAEIQRESFVAKGSGRYTVGPGAFNSQALTIHGFGKPATSNLSRKMHFQFLIYEPTDKTQPVYGNIDFTAGNFLQNSANLLLDLAGPTGSEVNGLPTHLYWAHDAASGTAFAGTGAGLIISAFNNGQPTYGNFPTNYFTPQGVPISPLDVQGNPNNNGLGPTTVNNWNVGLGDVNFKFIPDAHPHAGTLGSGTVIFSFRGLLNYSGAQSQNDKGYN